MIQMFDFGTNALAGFSVSSGKNGISSGENGIWGATIFILFEFSIYFFFSKIFKIFNFFFSIFFQIYINLLGCRYIFQFFLILRFLCFSLFFSILSLFFLRCFPFFRFVLVWFLIFFSTLEILVHVTRARAQLATHVSLIKPV